MIFDLPEVEIKFRRPRIAREDLERIEELCKKYLESENFKIQFQNKTYTSVKDINPKHKSIDDIYIVATSENYADSISLTLFKYGGLMRHANNLKSAGAALYIKAIVDACEPKKLNAFIKYNNIICYIFVLISGPIYTEIFTKDVQPPRNALILFLLLILWTMLTALAAALFIFRPKITLGHSSENLIKKYSSELLVIAAFLTVIITALALLK